MVELSESLCFRKVWLRSLPCLFNQSVSSDNNGLYFVAFIPKGKKPVVDFIEQSSELPYFFCQFFKSSLSFVICAFLML